MRYTGKGNRLIWYAVVPCIAALYALFLMLDRRAYDDYHRGEFAAQLAANAAARPRIDGVILGGSNAHYGLSAELLSRQTGRQWLNFSLLHEAFSDENYWRFVDDAIPAERRTKVKEVVYSSITPLRRDLIKERLACQRQFDGRPENVLVPAASMAKDFREWYSGRASREGGVWLPLPNDHGDYNEFAYKTVRLDERALRFERNTDSGELTAWVQVQLTTLARLFPNAAITLVVPSEYYGGSFDAGCAEQVEAILASAVKQAAPRVGNRVRFVHQRPFPDARLISDGRHHASSAGRAWRTEELLRAMHVTGAHAISDVFAGR